MERPSVRWSSGSLWTPSPVTILCDHSKDLAPPCKEGEGTHRPAGHSGGCWTAWARLTCLPRMHSGRHSFVTSRDTPRPPIRCSFLRFASPLGQCRCPGQGAHLRCMSLAVSGQWAEVWL